MCFLLQKNLRNHELSKTIIQSENEVMERNERKIMELKKQTRDQKYIIIEIISRNGDWQNYWHRLTNYWQRIEAWIDHSAEAHSFLQESLEPMDGVYGSGEVPKPQSYSPKLTAQRISVFRDGSAYTLAGSQPFFNDYKANDHKVGIAPGV